MDKGDKGDDFSLSPGPDDMPTTYNRVP